MHSARLTYEPLEARHAEALLSLARDAHVRRWLLDGEIVPDAWPEIVLDVVRGVRAEHGLDFYVASADGAPVGFCGYFVFEEHGPEPQLLYALLEPHTGRGLATEMAEALIEVARRAGRDTILSAVDAPNAASIRVLEKVGFEATGSVPGAFGETIMFRRSLL
ncbi:MAG: GNAT family N-acetyltransferase [Deltaproteobacteria bacterium]|jgi:RimJ/RimL family protein N-acetyltransferase